MVFPEGEVIRLEGVTKFFPGTSVPAVDQLSLDVASGEVCVLIGASGCGKSTTLKMINRLIEPSSGRIHVDGQDTAKLDPIELRQGMGYVIQEIGLFPHMTIAENIATVPREKGWASEKIRPRVDELLSLVGLDPGEFRDRMPASLSGGQRQRVGVARALAADPPVLLMDEPFGAVDPVTRAHLHNEFLRLQTQMNKTVLFVTHDMDEAMKLADRIAIMHRGRLIQHASPRKILGQPSDAFIEELVGEDQALKRLRFIQVGEIVRRVPTVSQGTPLGGVRQLLSQRRSGQVYVLDSAGCLLGTLSQDRAATQPSDCLVDELITPVDNLITPDTSAFEALCRILRHQASAVAVTTESGVLVGEVSFEQILWGQKIS
jgi:osmoprotectant transport system ATP-binding protein